MDALCVDQTPTAQAAVQLQMMDLIYECATVTLVALSGKSSNCGLPGVSSNFVRVKQIQETIDDCRLFTVPPTIFAEEEASEWNTRAWTLQEKIISRRYLYFSQHQMHLFCQKGQLSEADDLATAPILELNHPVLHIWKGLLGIGDVRVMAPFHSWLGHP